MSSSFNEQNNLIAVSLSENTFPPLNFLRNNHESIQTPAIFGIYESKQNSFVFYVKTSQKITRILGNDVFLAKSFGFFPVRNIETSRATQEILKGIVKHLSSSFLYYSPTWKLNELTTSDQNEPNEQRSCFTANLKLISIFKGKNDLKWLVTPFVQGFFGSWNLDQNRILHVISRRVLKRTGYRFYSRGSSNEGEVSNLVETETLVETKRNDGKFFCTSFVQFRGSMPFLWSQKPSLLLNSKIQFDLARFEENKQILQRHLKEAQTVYGPLIVILNLVNIKGDQGRLGSFYQDLVVASPFRNICPFIWFPINSRIQNWEKDSGTLGEHLASFLSLIKFNSITKDGKGQTTEVFSVQKGTVRTNCIDSIDRTNIGQFLVALKALCAFESIPSFTKGLQTLFAENGDALACNYAASNAQKSYKIT